MGHNPLATATMGSFPGGIGGAGVELGDSIALIRSEFVLFPEKNQKKIINQLFFTIY